MFFNFKVDIMRLELANNDGQTTVHLRAAEFGSYDEIFNDVFVQTIDRKLAVF